MPRFRSHKGSLEASLETTVEVADLDGLIAYLVRDFAPFLQMDDKITRKTVSIKNYGGIDERCGWDTHLVIIDDYGVAGMTDAMLT
jgi:hypothetical protein